MSLSTVGKVTLSSDNFLGVHTRRLSDPLAAENPIVVHAIALLLSTSTAEITGDTNIFPIQTLISSRSQLQMG